METCDVSCEISSDRKSHRKVSSDDIMEVINPEAKLMTMWNEWQDWQPCSRTCGVGTRIRCS